MIFKHVNKHLKFMIIPSDYHHLQTKRDNVSNVTFHQNRFQVYSLCLTATNIYNPSDTITNPNSAIDSIHDPLLHHQLQFLRHLEVRILPSLVRKCRIPPLRFFLHRTGLREKSEKLGKIGFVSLFIVLLNALFLYSSVLLYYPPLCYRIVCVNYHS